MLIKRDGYAHALFVQYPFYLIDLIKQNTDCSDCAEADAPHAGARGKPVG